MFKKALLLAIAFCCSGIVCEAIASPYSMGGQLGFASHNYNSSYLISNGSGSVDNNKFAGRVYGGIDFGEYLGLQLGYSYLGKPNFKQNSGAQENFSQTGLDLSGLMSIKFDSVGIYIKAGLEWMHRGSVPSNDQFIGHGSNNKLPLLTGLGVNYSFTNNLSTDVSWTRVFSSGDLPRTDFYALGFKYKFGEE